MLDEIVEKFMNIVSPRLPPGQLTPDELGSAQTEYREVVKSLAKHFYSNLMRFGDNRALSSCDLLRLIDQIKHLECGYVSGLFREINLEELLKGFMMSGAIELKDRTIIIKKSDSAVFHDAEKILSIESLRDMSDLQLIFSRNAFHLPYCNIPTGRSLSEHFFRDLLKKVIPADGDYKSHEAYRYNLLEEGITALRVITELCLNAIVCVSEIIKIINAGLKEAWHSEVEPGLVEIERSDIDAVLDWFIKDETFKMFGTKKLLNSSNNALNNTKGKITWITILDNLSSVLPDALELYKINCETFTNKLEELKRFEDAQATKFCDDLIVFIGQFKKLLDMLSDEQGLYQRAFAEGRKLLVHVEKVRENNAVKSRGRSLSAPNSPRGERNEDRSTGNLSPRLSKARSQPCNANLSNTPPPARVNSKTGNLSPRKLDFSRATPRAPLSDKSGVKQTRAQIPSLSTRSVAALNMLTGKDSIASTSVGSDAHFSRDEREVSVVEMNKNSPAKAFGIRK